MPQMMVNAETNKETNDIVPNPKSDVIIDFEDSMSEIAHSVKEIGDDIDPAQISSIVGKFESVMKYAGYVSTVLGIVNGSVAFMHLVGITKDPTEQKLIKIGDQLDNINNKMAEMDAKLNNITGEMAKIEASIEFHARDQKADYLMGRWHDFAYQYMETGLDSSMVEYESMVLNGLKNWCNNANDKARTRGGVDNNKIDIKIIALVSSIGLLLIALATYLYMRRKKKEIISQ